MAFLLRLGLRRCSSLSRRYYATFVEELRAEEEHALKTLITWKRISLFIAIPAVMFTAWHSLQKEKEHAHHVAEHGKPPFIAYSHLRIRNKPFPWGDGNHSLIHNPTTNALPEGYEEEE